MLYRRILFYYSFLIVFILLIWVIIFLPRPQSFIPLILSLPIVLHFFLGLVRPHKLEQKADDATTHEQKRDKLAVFGAIGVFTLFVNTICIFLYSAMYEYHSSSNTKQDSTQVNESSAVLKSLDEVLDRLGTLEASSIDTERQVNTILENQLKNEPDTLGIESEIIPDFSEKTATTGGYNE